MSRKNALKQSPKGSEKHRRGECQSLQPPHILQGDSRHFSLKASGWAIWQRSAKREIYPRAL
ncbi:hypothetical protein AX279_19490 [Pseudomonas sp. J237]|nr:hypothetical protein AX279_19490 [Pseudomonas sp. J237]